MTWTDALGNTVPDPFQAASTPRAASSVSSDSVVDGPTCYTIRSVPVIQTTGSDRFVTELAFQFTKAPNTHKVSVSCSLQVEAKIWGLQSTLEPYMLSEAKKQLSEFIPFLTSYFCEYGGARMLCAVPDAGPSLCPRGIRLAVSGPRACAVPSWPSVPPAAVHPVLAVHSATSVTQVKKRTWLPPLQKRRTQAPVARPRRWT